MFNFFLILLGIAVIFIGLFSVLILTLDAIGQALGWKRKREIY